MKLNEIRIIRSVLGDAVGIKWPLVLFRCLRKSKSLYNQTRWSSSQEPESDFVRRLSLAAAMYIELSLHFEQNQAFEIVQNIVVPIGTQEQLEHANQLKGDWKTEMERLEAFHELMDSKGGPRFNERKFLERDESICHFVVTRCVFHEFFTSVGVGELTRLFCEVDREFFTTEFPNLTFHRNGSWENTIAFDKDHCEFVFETPTQK